MIFRKPYRICNKAIDDVSGQDPAVKATLKEVGNCYELRVSIPGAAKQNFSVVISEGILYIYNISAKTAHEKDHPLACFLLPAHVQPDKTTALLRSYGLKIRMPKIPRDGIIIRIPVLRE